MTASLGAGKHDNDGSTSAGVAGQDDGDSTLPGVDEDDEDISTFVDCAGKDDNGNTSPGIDEDDEDIYTFVGCAGKDDNTSPGVDKDDNDHSTCAGIVPYGGHDGAGLRHDCRDLSLLLWLPGRPQPGGEDRDHLPSVLRAAVLPVPLRLWHEGREGCAVCCWQPQTQIP